MEDRNPVLEVLSKWVESCAIKGELSRNNVAIAIVVLDHLRRKCPLERSEVLSPRGEVKGARSGLAAIFAEYDIPTQYLKEVTTRAGHQDGQRLFEALDYGRALLSLPGDHRDRCLAAAIDSLRRMAMHWLARRHLRVNCDRHHAPSAWIESILAEAKGRSAGAVEQHLIGAKLERRHPDLNVPNNPSHAGDAQTGRPGDFVVGSTSYHVTASPGSGVLDKCAANLRAGLHPVLVVPRAEGDKARHFAEDKGIADRVTILTIEEFVASNIIEMAKGQQDAFVTELKAIVATYNRRLEAVETDLSLKIEVD